MKPQCKRTKGWRMPAGAVYVGRPGRFGNPFDWAFFGRAPAVDFFRAWLADEMTKAERASTMTAPMTKEYERRADEAVWRACHAVRQRDFARHFKEAARWLDKAQASLE